MLDDIVHVSVACVLRPSTRAGRNPRVLIGHRFPFGHLAGLWEFPGGKVEPGETSAECALREVEEEVGLSVEIDRLLLTQEQSYPDRTVSIDFHLCRWIGGTPQPVECQAVRWVYPEDLSVYRFPDGNRTLLGTLVERLAVNPGES